jgi:alkylated DNA repair protein (DNA oxidative demethylase)
MHPTDPDLPRPTLMVRGFAVHRGLLTVPGQLAMAAAVADILAAAPPVRPVTPGGRAMSVRMTAAGRLGWVTGRAGYRYATRHPDGRPWPPIPSAILDLWRAVTGLSRLPDCCLVNLYDGAARMGLHQDRDEGDFSYPVVSVSLGDAALFRMGGTERRGPTESLWLESGDVVVMGGAARLAYHGIDRVRAGSSRLLPQGGRINLTLRVVSEPLAAP